MTSNSISAQATRPPARTLFPYTTLFRSHRVLDLGDPHRLVPFARQRRDGLRHERVERTRDVRRDRKSTRLNSSHGYISYAAACWTKNTAIPASAAAKSLKRTAINHISYQ